MIAAQPESHSVAYVETDIPPGLTIREWRARQAAERAAQDPPPARRLRVLRWVLAIAAHRRAAGRRLVWRSEVRHSSGARGSMSA